MLMSFPICSLRDEDLWFAWLFTGVQKGASSLIIFLVTPWMCSQPLPPAYSCGHFGCALNLNEPAQTAVKGAPQWGGQA